MDRFNRHLQCSVRRALMLGLAVLTMCIHPLIAQELPLKVVPRTRSAIGYIFDQPSLVVIARVYEQVRAQTESDDPAEMMVVKPHTPFWTYVHAQVHQVLRVNERRDDEPDLRQGYFVLEQMERGERPIPLELGHFYLFLLNTSPNRGLYWNWKPLADQLCNLPGYMMAVPQGGFEIVDGRLRPLVKGGPLDAYDGRLLSEVIEEMRKRQ